MGCPVSLSIVSGCGVKPVADSQGLVQDYGQIELLIASNGHGHGWQHVFVMCDAADDCVGIWGFDTMRQMVIAVTTSILLFSGCKEDPERAANKLFVETSAIWKQYQVFPEYDPSSYQARLDLLVQIRENLDYIRNEYAESSLAVELASTSRIRNLDMQDVEKSISVITQSIPASSLMANTSVLWIDYQKLPKDDPKNYDARLKLLTEIFVNLNKMKTEFPLSYEVVELKIDTSDVKLEIERITQSIPASALIAKTIPLWELYQTFPKNDPLHYDERLELISEILLNLDAVNNQYPQSVEASAPVIDRLKAKIERDEIIQSITCANNFQACAISKALEAALKIPNKPQKVIILTKIASVQALIGEPDETKSTLSIALASAVGAEDLAIVAKTQFDTGQTQAARTTVSRAYQIAKGIQYDPPRARAFAKIANVQAAMGDVDEAKSTISVAVGNAVNIPYGLPKIEALSDIAVAQARVGELAQAQRTLSIALESADAILSDVVRAETLIIILKAHILSGDPTGANSTLVETLRLIEAIPEEARRADALAAVAELLVDANDNGKALEIANKIRYGAARLKVVSAVAVSLANSGDIASALRAAEDIPDGVLRDKVYAALAGSYAATGNTAKGFEFAEGIKSSTHRIDGFIAFALALSSAR